jgi:glycosyltransferase involved in cell wall biosynthesis
VLNLASTRVKVAGWVPDLAPLLRESLAMVAPLRYGAGVKGKVTESMGAGLPVVTTTVGVEGLDVEDGHNVIVADEPEAIARRIVELHRDAELWARLSREGQQVVAAAAAPDVQRRVLERLAGVRDARQATPA